MNEIDLIVGSTAKAIARSFWFSRICCNVKANVNGAVVLLISNNVDWHYFDYFVHYTQEQLTGSSICEWIGARLQIELEGAWGMYGGSHIGGCMEDSRLRTNFSTKSILDFSTNCRITEGRKDLGWPRKRWRDHSYEWYNRLQALKLRKRRRNCRK